MPGKLACPCILGYLPPEPTGGPWLTSAPGAWGPACRAVQGRGKSTHSALGQDGGAGTTQGSGRKPEGTQAAPELTSKKTDQRGKWLSTNSPPWAGHAWKPEHSACFLLVLMSPQQSGRRS